MTRTAEPYPAVFRQLEQLVAPGDQTTSRLWGLTGWSMNWWIVATELFAILLVMPFMLGQRGLYTADLALCGSAGVLLSASFWTRPALISAITSQRQLLCCRISRPFLHKTITQAPLEAAHFAGFRRAGCSASYGIADLVPMVKRLGSTFPPGVGRLPRQSRGRRHG